MSEENKWSTRNFDIAKGAGLLAVLTLIVIAYFAALGGTIEPSPTTLFSPTQIQVATQPANPNPIVEQPQIASDGTVTLSGSAEAGSTVELWAGETKLAEITPDENGRWTYAGQLPPGDYEIVARTVSPEGEILSVSDPVELNVSGATNTPSTTVSAVQIASIAVEPGGVVTISGSAEYGLTIELWTGDTRLAVVPVQSDGSWSTTLQLDEGDYIILAREVNASGQTISESQAVAVSITNAAVVSVNKPKVNDSGEVSFSGTAEPGTTVSLEEDGVVLATTVAKEDGEWALSFIASPGDHTLTVMVQEETGEKSSVASVTVAVPSSEGGQSYIVKRGDWLKQLARRFYGDPERWIDIYNATNARAAVDSSFHVIVDPNYLLPGWKIWIPEP